MFKKLLLTALAVGLLSVTALSAKSYDISIAKPSQAGTVKLPAGEYSLKIKGSDAVFTNVQNGNTFSTPTTVENVPTKFESTAVESVNKSGTESVQSIDLAGTKTKLRFK